MSTPSDVPAGTSRPNPLPTRGSKPNHQPKLSARARGRWGEEQAVRLFNRLGYQVLARNWRSPYRELVGEIDLIAVDGEVIVFCEVKARQRHDHGGASAAVDLRKQNQVRALAAAWLVQAGGSERDCRFDVVACDGVRITHHIAAF